MTASGDKFSGLVNGISSLGLAAAAAVLSATIIKNDMIPVQLSWLGTAGTVLTACLFPICYMERALFRGHRIRRSVSVIILCCLVLLLALRLRCTVDININAQSVLVLVGTDLTPEGERIASIAKTTLPRGLVSIAGIDSVPTIYGRSFTIIQAVYLTTYIALLACYTVLISVLTISDSATNT